jgi:hypothetical protein
MIVQRGFSRPACWTLLERDFPRVWRHVRSG